VVKQQCTHSYCHECFQKLVTAGLENEDKINTRRRKATVDYSEKKEVKKKGKINKEEEKKKSAKMKNVVSETKTKDTVKKIYWT